MPDYEAVPRETHLLNYILELDARGYSRNEITYDLYKEKGIHTSTDRVRHALDYARTVRNAIADKPIPVRMPYYDKYASIIKGDEVIAKNSSLLSSVMEMSKRKILVLADLHVPFTDEDKLQRAVELNRSADICVLAGDVLDQYGCSRWRKKIDVPHEQEIDGGVRLLEYLSETFKVVLILRGNHDERPIKKIRDSIPSDLLYLVDSEGPLGRITRPFSNVWYHDNWYLQVGDAVFTHAEISSAVEGKSATMTTEFFLHKGWMKRLGMDNIRVVVQAHTHQVSAMYREDLKMLESGCMAKTMDYTLDASGRMRPPQNGCVSVVQNNGLSDFNQTREYLL